MLDIRIIAIGKLKDQPHKELAGEYLKRIKLFARLEVIELPEVPFGSSHAKQAKEKEGESICESLMRFPDAFVIALDENGSEYDSVKLAGYLEKQNKTIVMVVGGSLGLSEKALKQCRAKLALSRLTFTHGLARIFLLEQIYRAATIINGKNYHH